LELFVGDDEHLMKLIDFINEETIRKGCQASTNI
jgi:hypothetical protein